MPDGKHGQPCCQTAEGALNRIENRGKISPQTPENLWGTVPKRKSPQEDR